MLNHYYNNDLDGVNSKLDNVPMYPAGTHYISWDKNLTLELRRLHGFLMCDWSIMGIIWFPSGNGVCFFGFFKDKIIRKEQTGTLTITDDSGTNILSITRHYMNKTNITISTYQNTTISVFEI